MEDGSDDTVSSAVISPPINNGEVEVMANFPNVETDCSNPLKVNGDTNLVESQPEPEEKDSSDCDALVIDESAKPPKKKKIKTFGPEEEFTHTNPYFSESIFDLSTQYNKTEGEDGKKEKVVAQKKVPKVNGKKLRGKNGKPKLREYAQYLGLQPTVQFKCSKCGSSGFQSLQSLNEHLTNCTSRVPINPPAPLSNNTTNFRVTRKVFLCSACGTYYENWNLFLHMREVHKRFICLYCLGMFPHAEKLSLHLISKHNCAPGRFETKHDFFGAYKEPCFLMCCDCQTVFNEQEDFINHECIESVKETISEEEKPKLSDEIKTEPSECLSNQEVNEENISKETDGDSQNQNSKTIETSDDLGEKQMSDLNMLVEERQVNAESNNHCDENAESATINPVDISEDNKSVVDEEEKSVHGGDDKCVQDEEEKSVADEEEKINVDDEHVDENEEESFENLEPEESVNADSSQNLEQDNVEEKGEENCEDMDQSDEFHPEETPEEVRKVPKVTLKLPKITNYPPNDEEDEYQSEDSEKLTMEVEKESDVDMSIDPIEEETENCKTVVEEETKNELAVPTAGPDIAIIELELEQALDKSNMQLLLQKCLRATIGTCLYCNHARKICVNGKQLGLHAIAEHRYSAINKSITAEELIPESFNSRIKESFEELEKLHFNLESTSSEGGVTFSHIFECFQCRYSSNVHKELYLHNRKLHAKAILLCIMCKTSFYSYSELICHLCPGIYSLHKDDIHFRCCLCVSGDIPSAFRLMVHLRKKHHVCDVCLEMCHNQSRLSNHIWKHKLHHFCYRCGIVYRNKPDITKHLFWKHGTESVLCRKCLQKKWPHMYHFCIPPTNFSCEECNLTFTRAVSLMVHKRIHKEEFPHVCTEENCTEKFISKKLLAKHELKHKQPIEEPKKEEEVKPVVESPPESKVETKEEEQTEKIKIIEEVEVEEKEKPKPKVDVYDLPELNLSESDSSESEDEEKFNKTSEVISKTDVDNILDNPQEEILKTDDTKLNGTDEKPVPVIENIWDDFKNYQANIAKLDILTDVGKDPDLEEPKILTDIPAVLTLEDALRDHDYCAPTMDTLKEQDGLPENSADHDYCSANEQKDGAKSETTPSVPTQNNQKPQNKNLSSDSSSDSDSSSCTCGSNCSCSSSSDSSSSTSDSSESDSSSEEGRRRQQVRREKRRQKKVKPTSENASVDVVATDNSVAPLPVITTPLDTPIRESDLDTTETDTDEEFYDKEPQKIASKLLAEKREKLLQIAAAAGNTGNYINGSIIDSRPSTPSLPEEVKPKKKSKSKKKKKKKSSKHDSESNRHANIPVPIYPTVAPITLSIPKNSPTYAPVYSPNVNNIPNVSSLPQNSNILSETDSNTRASKRRRVPNKFYGYSSDEEAEKANATTTLPNYKFRKVDLPSPVVPPLTIKAPPTPTVEPISIRVTAKSGEMRVQPLRLPFPKRTVPKLKPMKPRPIAIPPEAGSDSNSSSSEDEAAPKIKEQPALYCYCRCPYDEVSEMIGCDADDCAIEWFHFECVGIMVPPKGQWYCPDCRKKKQQRRDMLQAQMS